MLIPHVEYDEFLDRARRLLARATVLDGTYYRTTGPKYLAPRDIISGEGAKKGGGRWTPRDAFLAVYASTTAETAPKNAFITHTPS